MYKQVNIIENPNITVRYNGYIDEDYGYFIIEQMKKCLKVGEMYNVRLICQNYGCVDGDDFYDIEQIGIWFPCKSFDLMNKKDLMIAKYNLK